MPERVIHAENLKRFCREALVRVGVPAEDAAVMAFVLVEGDLRGVETHGTVKLPGFIELLRKGELNPRAEIKVSRETSSTAVIDGDRCAAGLAAFRAMELAISKAKQSSLGAVTVRNVGRCGSLATFTSLAVEHGMIGLMTAQGTTEVPPYGGKTRLLNTSPWSFAIPAGAEPPIVLDMASTVVSHGKLALTAKEKGQIPLDWLLDANGVPTADPGNLNTGFQTWIGGYKGYGLAVVDQVLAGILGGAPLLGAIPAVMDIFKRGHFVMAIRVESFMELSEFRRQVDTFIRTLKSSDPIEGAQILLPGERAFKTKVTRLASGIPIRPAIWRELESLASELGVHLHAE